MRLESVIRDALILREHVVSIFFDLEKAYDTTWKHGIMRDLHDMGLRGNMPLLITNFYLKGLVRSGRVQRYLTISIR